MNSDPTKFPRNLGSTPPLDAHRRGRGSVEFLVGGMRSYVIFLLMMLFSELYQMLALRQSKNALSDCESASLHYDNLFWRRNYTRRWSETLKVYCCIGIVRPLTS